jgi:hypothetical protein
MVDTLEKMGISHHFSGEIKTILDFTYRYGNPSDYIYIFASFAHCVKFAFARSWLRNDEEIIMDMETCAMAFRILRMHGYDITCGTCLT